MKKLFFNKKLFFLDVFYWIVSALTIWFWRFFSEKVVVLDYIMVLGGAMLVWIIIALFLGRYNKYLSFTGFFPRLIRLILITLVFAVLTELLSEYFIDWISGDVLFLAITGVGILAVIGDMLYFSYRYALNVDDRPPSYRNVRSPQPLTVPVQRLLPSDLKNLENTLYSLIGQKGINVLNRHVDLGASTTKCLITGTLFNVSSLRAFHYDTIINLMPLNTIRGINKIFCTVNTKVCPTTVSSFVASPHRKSSRRRSTDDTPNSSPVQSISFILSSGVSSTYVLYPSALFRSYQRKKTYADSDRSARTTLFLRLCR